VVFINGGVLNGFKKKGINHAWCVRDHHTF